MTNLVLCQDKNKKYILESPTPMYEIISNSNLHIKQYYTHGKKQKERQVLDLLLWFHLNGKRIYADPGEQYNKGIYVSQEYLAKKLGVTREWINKLLKRLEKVGFISSYYRNFNTKLYKVSFWFFLQDNLKFLSQIFPALRKAWLASYKHLSFTLIKPFLVYVNKHLLVNCILQSTMNEEREKTYKREKDVQVDKGLSHQYSVCLQGRSGCRNESL
jgi:DNA-binding Lrp family transcriptional regulator